MQRNTSSHKGENGRIAVIGGSLHMHGAPLLCALAAEATGVDLLHVCIPTCHAEVAKNASLNFQIYPYKTHTLTTVDVEPILELLATIDVAIIGPGIAQNQATIQVMTDIIAAASCALVLDATALQPNTMEITEEKSVVLTPHLGELERMNRTQMDIQTFSSKQRTIVCKGVIDNIYHAGKNTEVVGGNAGLTVGGTGDVLAGLIGGLIAQDLAQSDACVLASKILKRSAEGLYLKQGYAFTARDVLNQIPTLLHAHDDLRHD